MVAKPKIMHSTLNKKFYCVIDGKECMVEYDWEKDGKGNKVMQVYHTFVPDVLRGQGIAKELMLELVKYLEENNIKVHPTCSYALKFFGEGRYQKYVAES